MNTENHPVNRIERSVSIHPYFKVRAGSMDVAKGILRDFIARTSREAGVLYYEFTIGGDVVFCREAYVDADAALVHIANVGEVVDRMLGVSELMRIELHGPAAELDKLRGPFAAMNPLWFVYECGIGR